ncbi:lipoprotein NlpI [Stieleria neptunia]|uniref:Lipoprotein NlpI n=1 Tax=Stieleria neptunia TaxID=2527979 RepID=A0A518HK76_9BACT|nr:tetratricopeptide repeat protein [Stieleria neptunia]QDV41241.1 lipoprotein NlpI [Stieleria neptunia]
MDRSRFCSISVLGFLSICLAVDSATADAQESQRYVDTRGQLKHARNLFDAGKPVAAMDAVNDVIEHHPSLAEAYATRGSLRQYANNHEEAVDDLSKAISQGMSRCEIYVTRAISKTELGDFSGAIADCSTAIELTSDSSFAYAIRGSSRLRQKAYKRAIDDLDMAIMLDVKCEIAYLCRAVCRLNEGDIVGAAEDFRKHQSLKAKSLGHDGYRAYDGQPFTTK